MNENICKVSIGLPVYNGEKFIKKRIENLLKQTFSDFELIISDNASTDSTFEICKQFESMDPRIRCIKQEKNMGGVWNFNFVLKEAKGEYFLWVGVDDLLEPTFLEKNINILESQKNVVCSVSKIRMFGDFTEYLKIKSNDSIFKRIEKKVKKRFSYMDTFPATEKNYELKVCNFLKNCRHNQIFYGVYRKKILEKCFIDDSFIGFDTAYSLSILRYGDLYVIDEVLMEVFDGGESRSGMIEVAKRNNKKIIWIIFPYMQFTVWCKNYLGTKLFLKNFSYFFRLNLIGLMSLSLDILRKIK